ncbi:MAG: RES domain-containing protein [Luteitalea sp.]|nr:RES domain-containing protein [Luteitalea sp.]
MSSGIWTRCAGDSRFRPFRLLAWRVVEAQHQVATRKLVDTLEEQALLEDLIEAAKPPDRTDGRLHYLLSTPFRYPPLAHGSRFASRYERGIWYGSEGRRTAFAEVAYYRFVFLDGTRADLGTVTTELTAFTVRISSERGVDLVAPPFDADRPSIASPSAYGETQVLGRAMRDAHVELFRYPSARDAEGGVNVGIFSPAAFGTAKPRGMETWRCTATRDRVELMKRDYFEQSALTFRRETFLVDGTLPAPAP